MLKDNLVAGPIRAGTGHIKLKTFEDGEYYSYRFYNGGFYPRSLVQIHTHSSTFHSTILKGTLRNIVYNVAPTDEPTQYYKTQGKCGFDTFKSRQIIHENVDVSIAEEFTKSEGEDYTFDSDLFHIVTLDTPAVITKLQAVEKATIPPYYIVDREVGNPNPWTHTLDQAHCWKVIMYCLST